MPVPPAEAYRAHNHHLVNAINPITYSRVPITTTSRITELERPTRFVDEQVRGPFRSFHHEHLFTPAGAGITVMVDRVHFDAPLGVVGRLAELAVLDRYLQRLIDTRNAFLKDAAERNRDRWDGSTS
jgi:ligand-binding SRPBCC domain-containing protein